MQSTAKKLEKRLVDTARENLEAMPPPPAETKLLSMREAIKELTPTIAKLLRRGHTRESVVALLKEQGIDCSPATFRSIYRAPKPRARNATSGASKTTPSALRANGDANATPLAREIAPARSPASGPPAAGRGDARGVVPTAPQASAKAS